MSNTSNVVTESKKISELPLTLDIKDDAVVAISQNGVTVKMKLALLIQLIEERVAGSGSSIIERIKKSETAASDAQKAAEKVGGNLKAYQEETSNKFIAQGSSINAVRREVRESIYYKNEITFADHPDNMVMSKMIGMEGLAVGDTFDLASSLYTDTATSGAYTFQFKAKKGDILEAAYTVTESESAPYVIITDTDQMVIALLTVSEFALNGYIFKEDGNIYLSVMQPESADMIKYTHFKAIDFTGLIDKMNIDEILYDETMVTTPGKICDTAAAIIGDKYTPIFDYGSTATAYAHKQRVKEGWTLSFEGCQELVRGDAYTQLVIMDGDDIVTKVFDFSLITESFEYTFSSEEKYFYLSSDALTADPIFKLKKKRTGLPFVTEEDDGKVLQVVNGEWKAVSVSIDTSAEDGNGVAY